MKNTMIVRIPFEGFYNSILDSYLEDTFESWYGEENNEPEDVRDWDDIDWKATHLECAKVYTEQWLHEFGFQGKFDSMVSPREYNFETDAVMVEFTRDDRIKIIELATSVDMIDNFKAFIVDTCTSRDGFSSNVSADWDDWGCDWDSLQYHVALLFLESEYNHRERVIDTMQGNGGFEIIFKD